MPRLGILPTLPWVLGLVAAVPGSAEQGGPKAGDRLDRILTAPHWEARVFAAGLASPDGLACDAEGRLCVVEESSGSVSRFSETGERSVIASGLHSPEGICLGPSGALLVVEDCAQGRLVAIREGVPLEVLAEGLDAPEGVAVFGGNIYFTESNAQLAENPFGLRTRVSELRRDGDGWSPPEVLLVRGLPTSFSELLVDRKGGLILANELAGPGMRGGLVRFDPASSATEPLGEEWRAPEGLAAAVGDDGREEFYVAEEDVDGEGHGRISRIGSDGVRHTFASGFGTLEDVFVLEDGSVFVSEDSTGLVIELVRSGD